MKQIYRSIAVFALSFLLFQASSCKKMIDAGAPKNELVTEVVFRDSASATAAVLGVYSSMIDLATSFQFSNGIITMRTGLSSDELFPTGTSASEIEFYTNSISVTNSTNSSNLWAGAYRLIYQLNACIEGIGQGKLPMSVGRQLLGECLVARSFLYFQLVNLYGDVPLLTSTDFRTNSVAPRSPVVTVYSRLEMDLKQAISNLPVSYPPGARVRPSGAAGMALLSRIYLYQGKWQEAENYASQVLGVAGYAMESDLNQVFLVASKEAIWQLVPTQPGYKTTEGQLFIPAASASTKPRYALTQNFMAAFETGDVRKTSWTKSKTISGTTYFYPFKYKLNYDGGTVSQENYMLLRVAEMYLVRAEARAQLSNAAGALQDLNAIRSRASLAAVSFTSGPALLQAIYKERRIELVAEWGHRWFDLKRTGQADPVLASLKGTGWQPTDVLYPIPQSEIEANPALTQNPGY